MKTYNNYMPTGLKRVPTEAGESIEERIRRLMANNEPTPEEASEIYTNANEGILPEYDIRTDRFDIALEAGDKFEKSDIAKNDGMPEYHKEEKQEQQQQQLETEV